jgi:hypothetical protein
MRGIQRRHFSNAVAHTSFLGTSIVFAFIFTFTFVLFIAKISHHLSNGIKVAHVLAYVLVKAKFNYFPCGPSDTFGG